MFTQKTNKWIFIFSGTVIFNFLFWNEGFGINIFLFTLFIIGSIYAIYPDFAKSKAVIATMAGMFVLSVIIVVYSSTLSVWMYFISLFILTGFLNQDKVKSIQFAVYGAFVILIFLPVYFIQEIKIPKVEKKKQDAFFRKFYISFIPIVFLIIFYFIFLIANPVFLNLNISFFETINSLLNEMYNMIAIEQITFSGLGFTLLSMMFSKYTSHLFNETEQKYSDYVKRIKKQVTKNLNQSKLISVTPLNLLLKNECLSGIILISAVNVLLLVINCIDISWVWFGFTYVKGFDLSQFVHEGTYLLILSILLSIGIMLYFFRGNLNFYSKNKWLINLTYIWIFQNIILTFSVVIRNYHYIYYYGLTYKRIGVFIFLILVLFGLFTLYLKIKKRKSAFFLLKTNLWAAYALMILINFADWDIIIARYNLNNSNRKNIDIEYLLNLSYNTLPLIYEHTLLINDLLNYPHSSEQRLKEFYKQKENKTWLSWNLAEHKTYKYFKK